MIRPILSMLVVLVACVTDCPAGRPIIEGELGRRLDRWMTGMERYGMHGAILVEKDGAVILQKGYGLADRSTGQRITAETMFDIGSLAKQFTATAIMSLQADGLLDVNDSIAKHLDGVPTDKQAITIHHLLTHTAGLPYHAPADIALQQPLATPPGERFAYSNPGYVLLARIIDRVTNAPLPTVLEQRLFEPAGLERTCCVGTRPWPFADAARAYTDQTEQGSIATWQAAPESAGPGGIASCVPDLLRWERALRGGAVISAELVGQMRTPHASNPGSNVGYGYGWMLIETIRGTPLVLHQGNFAGFNADYRVYTDEGLTIIFLSNHFVDGRSMRDAVVNRVSMLINGGEVPEPPATVQRDTPAPAGIFVLDDGARLELAPIDGGVSVTAQDQTAMNLVFAPDVGEQGLAFVASCNEQTTRFFEHVFVGDAGATAELVAPALPFPGAWSSLQESVRDLIAEHGPLVSIDTIGTALTADGGSGRSVARLELERGGQLMQLTWTPRGVLHIARVDGPPARRFLVTAGGRFTAFDIFTGLRVTLNIEESRLVVRGNDGAIAGVGMRRGDANSPA